MASRPTSGGLSKKMKSPSGSNNAARPAASRLFTAVSYAAACARIAASSAARPCSPEADGTKTNASVAINCNIGPPKRGKWICAQEPRDGLTDSVSAAGESPPGARTAARTAAARKRTNLNFLENVSARQQQTLVRRRAAWPPPAHCRNEHGHALPVRRVGRAESTLELRFLHHL